MSDQQVITEQPTNGASADSGAPSSLTASDKWQQVQAALRAETTNPLADPPAVTSNTATLGADGTVPSAETPAQPGAVQDADGRWRNPDGTFASAPPVDATAAAPETPSEPAGPEPVRVTLKGLPERGEADLDVEIGDPAIAERIQRALKGEMRREEFSRQMEAVKAQQAELREFEALLTETPEVIVAQMPAAMKQRVAEMLLPELWESLIPTLEQYASQPHTLQVALATQKAQLVERQQQAAERVRYERQAMAIEAATESLIPETADDATRALFLRDAQADVLAEIQSNPRLTPADVPRVLARRLALYGWTAGPSAPAATVPSPAAPSAVPAAPVVRPVATPAPQAAPSAQPSAPASAAPLPNPKHAQARQIAAALPGGGVGAAVVQQAPPKVRSIEEMSNWIRRTQRAG